MAVVFKSKRNSMNVYLKYSKKDKIRFPVTPAEIELESPYGVNRVGVAHKGEVTVAGYRQLKSVTLSSFFPKHYNPTYCGYKGFKSPEYYRHKIEKWRDKRKPIRLVITQLNISMEFLIEEFTWRAEAGSPGDLFFEIKLTQYKQPPSTKIKKKKKKADGKKGTRPKKTGEKTVTKNTNYTVKQGDSLSLIAKKYYGDVTKWRKIYNYAPNRKVIGANPNKIKAGQKLVIPK